MQVRIAAGRCRSALRCRHLRGRKLYTAAHLRCSAQQLPSPGKESRAINLSTDRLNFFRSITSAGIALAREVSHVCCWSEQQKHRHRAYRPQCTAALNVLFVSTISSRSTTLRQVRISDISRVALTRHWRSSQTTGTCESAGLDMAPFGTGLTHRRSAARPLVSEDLQTGPRRGRGRSTLVVALATTGRIAACRIPTRSS
jgi:hypothetical protein